MPMSALQAVLDQPSTSTEALQDSPATPQASTEAQAAARTPSPLPAALQVPPATPQVAKPGEAAPKAPKADEPSPSTGVAYEFSYDDQVMRAFRKQAGGKSKRGQLEGVKPEIMDGMVMAVWPDGVQWQIAHLTVEDWQARQQGKPQLALPARTPGAQTAHSPLKHRETGNAIKVNYIKSSDAWAISEKPDKGNWSQKLQVLAKLVQGDGEKCQQYAWEIAKAFANGDVTREEPQHSSPFVFLYLCASPHS